MQMVGMIWKGFIAQSNVDGFIRSDGQVWFCVLVLIRLCVQMVAFETILCGVVSNCIIAYIVVVFIIL